MTRLNPPFSLPPNTASQMTDHNIHHYREHDPFLAEELQRQQDLTEAMADRRRLVDEARMAWQAALSRRWSCEIAAQRAYKGVQRQLNPCDDDLLAGSLSAPAGPEAADTPRALLEEVRRLELTVALLAPQPHFADEAVTRLRRAGDELEAAILDTDRCEAERRSVAGEQRVVARLIERSHERTLQRLARQAENE